MPIEFPFLFQYITLKILAIVKNIIAVIKSTNSSNKASIPNISWLEVLFNEITTHTINSEINITPKSVNISNNLFNLFDFFNIFAPHFLSFKSFSVFLNEIKPPDLTFILSDLTIVLNKYFFNSYECSLVSETIYITAAIPVIYAAENEVPDNI